MNAKECRMYTVRQLYNETEVIEQNWNKRLEYYLYFIQSTSLLHRYSEWHNLSKTGRTSARLSELTAGIV